MSNSSALPHPSLSIVVPLYNEEEGIAQLIEAIFSVLSTDADFLELVLVDDGSYDRTAEIVHELAEFEPRIRMLKHDRNRGLGAAIRTGIEAAEGDLLLYTDADLPFDFSVIPQLIDMASNEIVIVGYRTNRGEGLRRWILTKGYNFFCRFGLGLHVRDVNFACKLMPRHAVRSMRLASEGSFIDAELLLECKRQGFVINEVPLTYYRRTRGLSTLSRPMVIVGILIEMTRYFMRRSEAVYELIEEADHKRG
jgi:glycosyltransferase involved in cell wall biosynthesis